MLQRAPETSYVSTYLRGPVPLNTALGPMRDGDIDYSRYGLSELEEALAGINHKLYPKNYANLRAAYQQLTESLPAPKAHEQVEDLTKPAWEGPKYDEHGRYVPNVIPSGERTGHILFSLLLVAYGTYGVWVNDLYVPSKRRGIHLHDVPAWIMYGAIICACLVLLSVVIDHYDRRDNERHYRTFASIGESLGWSFFVVSLLWALFHGA